MTPVIDDLERVVHQGSAAMDAFFAENSFPLAEGTKVTFVFRGRADAVHLRHWIYGLPSSMPFMRVASSDVWRLTIDLPERSRVEYKLEVISNGEHQLIRDPLNPLLARDPFGANSVCHSSGYETPDWTLPDPEARPGRLRRLVLHSEALQQTERIQVYVPARFRRRRQYPLLIVHDGTDYLRYASLQTVLDN
ncbi:MAG: enterochelin esterase, partial [Acidobacteriota bacterium]